MGNLSSLLEVTQLLSGRGKIWGQAFLVLTLYFT